MATPSPTKRKLSDLKATILAPALTSHFECHFNPPPAVNSWLSQKQGSGSGVTYVGNESFFTLSCSEANLPGSQLATHEILNDFHGVTEKHAYRRQFDDRADFTFYVDREYNVIHLFENWISFIGNERRTDSSDIGVLELMIQTHLTDLVFQKNIKLRSLSKNLRKIIRNLIEKLFNINL